MPIGATIGAITSIAGMGLQAYGQHKAGQSAEKSAEAAAKASESTAALQDFNADVAAIQAQDTLDRGNQEADQFRTQVRGAIGTQRVAQAASGVDVGFGSAVDVQADAAYIGKLDEQQLRSNATRAAWGYTVSSLNYREQARISRETAVSQREGGAAAATAGNIAAVGTIATGAGSLIGKKYGFGSKD